MASDTIIAWTDRTANFLFGCTKVSEGCKHCYAETLTTNRMGLRVWGLNAPRQEAKGIWKNVPAWEREAARGDRPGNYGLAVVGTRTPTTLESYLRRGLVGPKPA